MRFSRSLLLVLALTAAAASAAMHLHIVHSLDSGALRSQVDLAARLLAERLQVAVLRNDAGTAGSLMDDILEATPVASATVIGLDGKALASWKRSSGAGTKRPEKTSNGAAMFYPIRTGLRPIGKLVVEPTELQGEWFSTSWLVMQSALPLLIGLLGFFLLLRRSRGEPGGTLGQDAGAAARELEEAKRALDSANHAKSMFLANMSHEIRTPLNGVLGMTDLLLGTPLDERQQKFTTTVRNSAESLLNIVNDLLDFSRIESGTLHLEVLDFNLRECVEDVAQLLGKQAQVKGLELVCQLSQDLPRLVRGDPARLRQVLVNLVGNAVKFTERGEVIVQVEVTQTKDGKASCRFHVKDTGIGIAQDVQQRIFDSFVQVDASTTRRFGGAGLGLAISRQLVELMGGTIGVRSEVGRGTEFTIDLELTLIEEATQDPMEQSVRLKKTRVLVVDDNDTNRLVLGHQLSSWDMAHEAAPDGPSALAMLRDARDAGNPYHIAILDMQMPGMDGLSLARAIKASPALEDTRLMLLTSAVLDMEPEALTAVGFELFTSKPVRQSQLYNCLVQLAHASPLPVKSSAQDETGPTTPVTVTTRFNAHVLLAEDNAVNQEVARHMFESLGCQVTVAENGRVALDRICAQHFDMVFMDCQMPVMDGFETTEAVRERERQKGVARPSRIIALTANALAGDREQCLAAGMDDYVSKPFKLAELERVLARWLPEDGADAANGERPEPARNGDVSPDADDAPDAGGVIETAALDTIRAMQRPGKPDLLGKVVRLYLDRAPDLIDQVGQAIERGEPRALQAAAHSLKSSSANLGATMVSEAARTLEQYGREGDLSAAGDTFTVLKAAHAAAARELQHYLPVAG